MHTSRKRSALMAMQKMPPELFNSQENLFLAIDVALGRPGFQVSVRQPEPHGSMRKKS